MKRYSTINAWGRPLGIGFAVAVIIALGVPSVHAGSGWMNEATDAVNNHLEVQRCMDRERASGTHKYTRCSTESQQRLDQSMERREELRRQKEEERRELEELTKGPNVFEEIQARYGAYFTFEECMGVFDERELYGKRGFSRAEARGACTKAVAQLRANCQRWGEEACAEKGFLRPDQTANAIRQQQLDEQRRQQEAMEQRQEQERQRKRALHQEWIRQGNDPNACPGLQALMDKTHWCHF